MTLCYVDRNVIVGVALLYSPSVLSHMDLQGSLWFPSVHMVAVVTENLVHGPSPFVVLTTNIQLVTSIAPVAPSRIVTNLPAAYAVTRRPHKSHEVEWHVSSLNAIPQLVHSVLARCAGPAWYGWGILVVLASFSALHYVNHSIGNCPVLLLFNTQPSFIRVTPVASGSVHVF